MRRAAHEQIGEAPRVGAAGRRADREILIQPDPHTGVARALRRVAQLTIGLELHPSMKVDPVRVLARELFHGAIARGERRCAGHVRQSARRLLLGDRHPQSRSASSGLRCAAT